MRAHVLQHVPFEGLGCIAPWLQARNAVVSWTRFHGGESLPALDNVDFLIALGGPMSVNDEAQRPWLVAEKQFVRAAINTGKPVLGICLGVQLIAASFGERVYPNSQREIGWFPVQGLPVADKCFAMPTQLDVLHWHGETFDLPRGAVQLARSAVCENQAFQLGSNVVGLQFHLEMTTDSVTNIVKHCRDELQPGAFVQAEADLLASGTPARFAAVHGLMHQLLDYLCRDMPA